MILLVDTSGLLAAVDATHPDGAAARRALARAGTLVVSPLVLAEFDHLGRRLLGRRTAHAVLDELARWAREGRVVLPAVTAAVLSSAQAIRIAHRDLQLDLADAVTVVLAATFLTDAVLTLDHRDFRAVRPLTRHDAFRLLPADG